MTHFLKRALNKQHPIKLLVSTIKMSLLPVYTLILTLKLGWKPLTKKITPLNQCTTQIINGEFIITQGMTETIILFSLTVCKLIG